MFDKFPTLLLNGQNFCFDYEKTPTLSAQLSSNTKYWSDILKSNVTV